MRDLKNTDATLTRLNVGIAPDVWTRQMQERLQYAQLQIRGTIEALDQILTAATEQHVMMECQVTEATEVLDVARDAVLHVVRGIEELGEAFMRARDKLAQKRRSD